MKYQPEVTNAIKGTVWGKGKNWKPKEGNIVAYQRSNRNVLDRDTKRRHVLFAYWRLSARRQLLRERARQEERLRAIRI